MKLQSKKVLWSSAGSAALIVGLAAQAHAGTATTSVDENYTGPVNTLFAPSASATALLGSVNDQMQDADVSATAGDSGDLEFYLDLFSGEDLSFTGSFDLDDNTVSASAAANNGTSTVSIDTLPTFGDDVATANVQHVENGVDVTATSYGATVAASTLGDDDGADTDLLNATHSVDGNAVNVTASGNTYDATTDLADNLTIVGAGGPASVEMTSLSVVDGSEFDATVTADIAMNSLQTMDADANVFAGADGTSVISSFDYVDGSTVSVLGNDVTATATVNDSAQHVATGEGAASVDAAIALANTQIVMDGNDTLVGSQAEEVYSSILMTQIGVDALDVNTSSVAVDDNTIAAASTLNTTDQGVDIAATDIGTATSAGFGAIADGDEVVGHTVVSNLQDVDGADAKSEVAMASIDSDLDWGWTNEDSDMSVSGNTMEASTLGNDAAGAIALDGTTVAGGAAVVSEQAMSDSDLSSTVAAASIGMIDGVDLGGTEAAIDNNALRAVAVAQSNSTSISVDAVDFDVVSDTSNQLTDDASGAIVAGNTQTIFNSTVDAVVGNGTVGASLDDVNSSSLSVDGNSVVAAAYGNRLDAGAAGSMVELNATTIAPGADANVVVATNAQDADELDLFAGVESGDDEIVDVYLDMDLENSELSTSANKIQAQTIGNQATTLAAAVDATVIDTSDTGTVTGADGGNDARAAFVAISDQNNAGDSDDYMSQTATLLDDVADPLASAMVYTWIGDDIDHSTVVADSNVLSASVIGNSAGTGIVLAATDISTSTAVSNDQYVDYGDMSALIGIEGSEATAGTAAVTSNNTAGTNDGTISLSGDIYTNDGATDLTFTFASNLTAAEAAFYTDAGLTATAGSNTATWTAGTTFDASDVTEVFTNGAAGADSLSITSAVTTPAIPPSDGTHNSGGVIVAIDDDMWSSDVSISSNLVDGSVRGNIATNLASVSGVNLSTQFMGMSPDGEAVADLDVEEVWADNVVLNDQSGWTDMESVVYGSFGFETQVDERDAITDSTIAVDDNALKATSVMNIATNSIAIDATNSDVQNALLSDQRSSDNGDGESITALADSEIFSPIVSSGSSISLSGNETRATAMSNEAVNTVTVSGVNLSTSTANAAESTASYLAFGDNVLVSGQDSNLDVSATADASIYNLDNYENATDGVLNGTVTIGDNIVVADALANRSNNTMTLSADSTLSQNGIILNSQYVNADVTAAASANIGMALMGDADTGVDPDPIVPNPAVDGSAVSVDTNIVSASARGSVTSNVLNASATGFDTTDGPAVVGGDSVYGMFSIYNNQDVSGGVDITAAADGVAIGVALNAVDSGTVSEFSALNASDVSVGGNVVQAVAAANTAYNAITVTGYDGGADESAALLNSQYSAAMVSAVVRNATVGYVSEGDVTGSSVGVTGNTLSASAVGNRVTSVITRN